MKIFFAVSLSSTREILFCTCAIWCLCQNLELCAYISIDEPHQELLSETLQRTCWEKISVTSVQKNESQSMYFLEYYFTYFTLAIGNYLGCSL